MDFLCGTSKREWRRWKFKKKKERKFDNPSFVYFEFYEWSESEKMDKFGKVIGISNLIFFHDEIEKTCKKVRIVNLVQISGN